MNEDTTTSGAADLPDALLTIAREIEALKRECGMDPESSIAVQNGRYMAISYKVRALAAGQATAAQAGAPANMRLCYSCGHPADAHPWVNDPRGGKRRGDCPAAPAQPAAEASRFGSPELQAMIIARCVEKDRADSVPAVSDLPPLPAPDLRDVGTKPQEIKEFLKGYATEYARTAIAARAPADSVLEDAMRYRWLREGNDAKHGAAWHVAVNLYGCEWDAAIDAAMNKGASHDR